jgi:hypothetical protein
MRNSHVAVQDELLVSLGPGQVHVCINCNDIVERGQLNRELDPLSLSLLAWDGGLLIVISGRCSHCKQCKQWVREVDGMRNRNENEEDVCCEALN